MIWAIILRSRQIPAILTTTSSSLKARKLFRRAEEYTSHNTLRLNIEETKELLLSLSFIRQDVLNEKPEMVYEP